MRSSCESGNEWFRDQILRLLLVPCKLYISNDIVFDRVLELCTEMWNKAERMSIVVYKYTDITLCSALLCSVWLKLSMKDFCHEFNAPIFSDKLHARMWYSFGSFRVFICGSLCFRFVWFTEKKKLSLTIHKDVQKAIWNWKNVIICFSCTSWLNYRRHWAFGSLNHICGGTECLNSKTKENDL